VDKYDNKKLGDIEATFFFIFGYIGIFFISISCYDVAAK